MQNRLAGLMEASGFRVSDAPESYTSFQRWSVEHQEKFYARALEDMKFPWLKRPGKMLEYDTSKPMWKARWFIGGEANVFNACVEEQVERGLGGQPALISYREDGRMSSLTFNEVKEKVNQIADHLKNEGVEKGDRVCMILPSSEEAYLLFYAIHKIGATFVPIPTEIMDIALVKRLEMTRPKLIFTADAFLYGGKETAVSENTIRAVKEVWSNKGNKPKIVEIGYVGTEKGRRGDDKYDNLIDYNSWVGAPVEAKATTVALKNTDITMILFTSGTTGTPKGTLHTFAALIEDMLENAYASNVNAGDRFLWYTSPGWMMFPWLITGSNGLGATAVLYDGSPRINGKDTMLKTVERFGITHLGVSPPLITDILESFEAGLGAGAKRTLREIRYTSAPLADSLANRLAEFGYAPNGACGGTDGCFCYCGGNPVTRRRDATMLPGLGIDVHVMVNEDGRLREAAANEVGEVVIKSPFPSMTMGLLNDDNDRSLFKSTYFLSSKAASESQESAYWLHKDLAAFDKDGYLTVHGRADDLLVVHGSKLSPMDVQDAILKGNREVQEVAPIALSLNPGDGGELLIFAVLKQSQRDMSEEARARLEERLKLSVKEKVNKFAKPHSVFFVEELPYTITNKLALRIIRHAIMGEEVGDISTIRNKQSIGEIRQLGQKLRIKV